MLGRAGHAEIFIFTALEVEVLHFAISVGIIAVEADALQCGGNEAEVTLVGQFHAQYVGIASIAGLGQDIVSMVVVGVVGDALVNDEIIDFLVEKSCTDQSNALNSIRH